MFFSFREYHTDKSTLLPLHSIRFIQDHSDGGASIFTNIPIEDDGRKTQNFRSRESAKQLTAFYARSSNLQYGLLSQL